MTQNCFMSPYGAGDPPYWYPPDQLPWWNYPYREPAPQQTFSFPAKVPNKCPICEGRGTVPNGFYEVLDTIPEEVHELREPCRACEGKGVILT